MASRKKHLLSAFRNFGFPRRKASGHKNNLGLSPFPFRSFPLITQDRERCTSSLDERASPGASATYPPPYATLI